MLSKEVSKCHFFESHYNYLCPILLTKLMCNIKGRPSFSKALCPMNGKLDENVYRTKKGKKFFDESSFVYMCTCVYVLAFKPS